MIEFYVSISRKSVEICVFSVVNCTAADMTAMLAKRDDVEYNLWDGVQATYNTSVRSGLL